MVWPGQRRSRGLALPGGQRPPDPHSRGSTPGPWTQSRTFGPALDVNQLISVAPYGDQLDQGNHCGTRARYLARLGSARGRG